MPCIYRSHGVIYGLEQVVSVVLLESGGFQTSCHAHCARVSGHVVGEVFVSHVTTVHSAAWLGPSEGVFLFSVGKCQVGDSEWSVVAHKCLHRSLWANACPVGECHHKLIIAVFRHGDWSRNGGTCLCGARSHHGIVCLHGVIHFTTQRIARIRKRWHAITYGACECATSKRHGKVGSW